MRSIEFKVEVAGCHVLERCIHISLVLVESTPCIGSFWVGLSLSFFGSSSTRESDGLGLGSFCWGSGCWMSMRALCSIFTGLFVFVGWRVELVIGFHLSLVAGAGWW